jgi:hypothetical protein
VNRFASLLSVSLLAVSACAVDSPDEASADPASGQNATGEQGLAGAPEPHEMHSHDAKTLGPPVSTKDVHLKNKSGGPVLVAAHTKAIFWGPQWGDGSTAFAGTKVTGLDRFFRDFGGSTFMNTNTEYTGGDGQFVTNSVTYDGHVFDTSNPPTKALSVAQAVTEACNQGGTPDPNTVYFIYTSTTAGHVSYCAWHSYGTCANGTKVQVAYMPNIDNIAGCDPTDTTTGHDEPLAALANVTAHELSEAITDPHLDAWQDSGGSENADKCAWKWDGNVTFSHSDSVTNPDDGTVTTTVTNEQWKLQMNFSNAAYDANVTHSGARGCIQSEAAPWGTPDSSWL